MKNIKRHIISISVAVLALLLIFLIIFSVVQQRQINAVKAIRESESIEMYESVNDELMSIGTIKIFSPVSREITPDEFIFYLGNSLVRAEYRNMPDFSLAGEQTVLLKVSIGDLSRNIEAKLTLFEIVENVSASYTDIENISVRDFLQNDAIDARFVGLSPSDIPTNAVGDYKFKIEVSGGTYDVTFSVVDDIVPVVQTIEYTAYLSEGIPSPHAFIDSIEDISDVTVEYLSDPVVDKAGKYDVDIVVTDSYGNSTTQKCVLNIIDTPTRSDPKLYTSSGSLPSDVVGRINAVAKKYAGYDYGIYARDLKTGYVFSYNSETNIRAASTIKAPFAYYVCLELEKEDCPYTLDSLLEYTENQYCIGEEGYMNRMPYGSKFTVREILDANITLSDNVAYYLLHDYFGHEGYNDLIKQLGVTVWLNGGNIKWGLYSPRELAVIWKEIYRYIEQDGLYNELLRDLLVGAEYNFTKAAIPHYSMVAHKSGFNNYSHCDAAIVYGDSSSKDVKPNDYVLCVMSAVNDSDSAPNKALIAEMITIADDIMCNYQNY